MNITHCRVTWRLALIQRFAQSAEEFRKKTVSLAPKAAERACSSDGSLWKFAMVQEKEQILSNSQSV